MPAGVHPKALGQHEEESKVELGKRDGAGVRVMVIGEGESRKVRARGGGEVG